MEREIIPMCEAEGMGIAPWSALGGGNFKTEEQRKANDGRKMGGPSETDLKVAAVLEKIAKKKNSQITSVVCYPLRVVSPCSCWVSQCSG